MKKILIVFGTRPEAIKLAPLIKELKKSRKFFVKICSTGQHDEMLDQVTNLFKLKIDISLKLMKPNQSLSEIFPKFSAKINQIIKFEKPDLLIVQGDTTTAFAAAITAFYNKVKIAHVEAGLRTYDLGAPWPEEANRKLISTISNLHFAPTAYSKKNLLNEGIVKKNIFLTGNTIVDALNDISKKIAKNKTSLNFLNKKFPFLKNKKKIILITLHRREIFGKKLLSILKSFEIISKKYKQFQFVYPVHLNPNIKKHVFKKFKNLNNFSLLPPIDYLSLIYIMKKSFLIMSDSGGIQEEAPSFKVPVIILRDKTERFEILKNKQAILAGTSSHKIIRVFNNLANNEGKYLLLKKGRNPFGDGKASKRITKILKKYI